MFICATEDTSPNITISWHIDPSGITHNPSDTLDLPGGGYNATLQITTSKDVTNITITCVITDSSTKNSTLSRKARLLVQGGSTRSKIVNMIVYRVCV